MKWEYGLIKFTIDQRRAQTGQDPDHLLADMRSVSESIVERRPGACLMGTDVAAPYLEPYFFALNL